MTDNSNLNRRQLLRGLTAGDLGAGFQLEEISARAADQAGGAAAGAAPAAGDKIGGPPVGLAVIGLGPRGREILTALAKVGPAANLVSICDSFKAPVFVKRAAEIAPKAAFVDDYHKVLED